MTLATTAFTKKELLSLGRISALCQTRRLPLQESQIAKNRADPLLTKASECRHSLLGKSIVNDAEKFIVWPSPGSRCTGNAWAALSAPGIQSMASGTLDFKKPLATVFEKIVRGAGGTLGVKGLRS